MKRQITVFEFIRLLLAIVLCFILYIAGAIAGWWLVPEGDDSFGSVVFLIGCRFLPAFLSTLLATLIPSWRYKIIAAVAGGVSLCRDNFGVGWGGVARAHCPGRPRVGGDIAGRAARKLDRGRSAGSGVTLANEIDCRRSCAQAGQLVVLC